VKNPKITAFHFMISRKDVIRVHVGWVHLPPEEQLSRLGAGLVVSVESLASIGVSLFKNYTTPTTISKENKRSECSTRSRHSLRKKMWRKAQQTTHRER